MALAEVKRGRSLILILFLCLFLITSPEAEARRRGRRRNVNFLRNRDLFNLILLSQLQGGGAGAFGGVGAFRGFNNFGDPFDPLNSLGGFGRFGRGGLGGLNGFQGGGAFGNQLDGGFAFNGLGNQFGGFNNGLNGAHGFGNNFGNNGFGGRFINPLSDLYRRGPTIPGNGARFADTALGQGPCGADFYPTLCKAAQAAKPNLERAVQDEMMDGIADFSRTNHSAPGTMAEMAKRALTGKLGNLKEAYQNYFEYWRNKLPNLDDLIESSRAAMKKAVDAEPLGAIYGEEEAKELRAKMHGTLDRMKIVIFPDANNPEEVEGYAKSCRMGEVNSAFADPHLHDDGTVEPENGQPRMVFLCLSRIKTALRRAGDDLNTAKADIDGTLKHEEAHLVYAAHAAAFKRQTACYYDRLSKPESLTLKKFEDAQLSHEIGADALAALATVKRIEDGDTFDLPAEQYMGASFARLCGTASSGDYLSGEDRAKILGETLAAHESTKSYTSCPSPSAGHPSCVLTGSEPRMIF